MVMLLGDQATELGEVLQAELGPSCALALSRGRFPKGYPYLDPNEDACLAVTDGSAFLLAVADGHNGFDAARAAITTLESAAPEVLADPDPASRAITLAADAVAQAVSALDEPRKYSRTALTVAVIDGDRARLASAGDSLAISTGRRWPRVVTRPAPFLSAEPSSYFTAEITLEPGSSLLLATDGLIDFLGRNPLQALSPVFERAQPRAIAEAAMGAAFDGAAGDNIAVAVLTL